MALNFEKYAQEGNSLVKTLVFNISSTAFENGFRIPAIHTCSGDDVSPPLQWEGEPKVTATFALILEDPDAPEGTFTHWIIYNLPPTCHNLEKNITVQKHLPNGGIQATNDSGKTGYSGPCPPKGEQHKYLFKIFALRKKLRPETIRNGTDFYKAINGLILDQAEYTGMY
jgi:Raf kinase inhibitor-like YbhB/YbcL family protein